MKLNTKWAAAVAAALFIVAAVSFKSAKGEQRIQPHSAVVLLAGEGNNNMVIYAVSCGGPCPVVKLYDDLGVTIANLLDDGFVMNHTGDGFNYTFTK